MQSTAAWRLHCRASWWQLWAMACAPTVLSLAAARGAWLKARLGLEVVRSAWLSWNIDRQLHKQQ
jgi:hypothetical protein